MERKISKTKIEKRLKKKTNPELVETIIKLKKTNPEVAKLLAMPIKKQAQINLSGINKSKGDVLIIGKVLSQGELNKKKKVVAWNFSEGAKEKIKKSGGEFVYITEEIKKNPELKSLEILR